jgi:hypothetical protein
MQNPISTACLAEVLFPIIKTGRVTLQYINKLGDCHNSSTQHTFTMPLDHLGLSGITDLEASRAFYEKTLGPLGYKVQVFMSRHNPTH